MKFAQFLRAFVFEPDMFKAILTVVFATLSNINDGGIY